MDHERAILLASSCLRAILFGEQVINRRSGE